MQPAPTTNLTDAVKPSLRRAAALMASCVLVASCSGDTDGATARSASVRVESEGCSTHPTVGGGAFIAPHRVLTVAHVIAGADDVDVVLADGTEKTAIVVAIDRRKDLALLDVDADVTPLRLGPLRIGARGTFASWRSGTPRDVSFVATEAVNIQSADIDHVSTEVRQGYAIEADILPGDSGSALVSDGRVVAVVFARSTHDRSTGWATAAEEVRAMLTTAGDTAVDVGVCPTQR